MSKIISVHSFRGGTGKSNTTANLAALFASSGLRVGVIDTDIQSPGIHVLFGMDAETIGPSLNDYLWGKCSIAEAAHDVTANLGEPISGKVFLVPSSIRAGEIARVLREGYDVGLLNDGVNDLVTDLNLDIALIDTHPGMNEETLLSISISDALVIILRPDMQDYQGTAVTVDVARKLEVPTMVLMVNKVPAVYNTADVRARVEDAYKCEVAAALPHSDELMALASSGIFALKYPDNPLTAGLKTLMARLLRVTEPSRSHIVHMNDWPIAAKITVLCTVIAIVLASALTAIGYSQAAAGLSQQADKEIEADAHLVETTIDDWHQQQLAVLALGAVTPAIVRFAEGGFSANAADRADALAVLTSISERDPDTETVGIMDSQGTYVLDVDPASIGSTGPQYDFYQQAMQGREFISGVRISGVTNKPALYHSVPIRNTAGLVVGVLRTRSSLETVSRVVEAAEGRLGNNADGVLLDANGLVIANTLNPAWLLRPVVTLPANVEAGLLVGSEWGTDGIAPPPLADTELASAIGVKQPTVFDWTLRGVAYHSLAMPLTQTDWTYVAALPFDTFEASARDILRFAIAAALVGISVAIAAGALIAQRLSRPLLRLTSAARLMENARLSSEQATALMETPDHDEIAELSRVFGRMAREVIQREVGLRSQVQVLTVQIDEARRGKEVAEITESEYFQSLAQRSREIRARRPPKLSA